MGYGSRRRIILAGWVGEWGCRWYLGGKEGGVENSSQQSEGLVGPLWAIRYRHGSRMAHFSDLTYCIYSLREKATRARLSIILVPRGFRRLSLALPCLACKT